MDYPRQRPEPAPAIRSIRTAIRYAAASVWVVILGVTANAVMFWMASRLLGR